MKDLKIDIWIQQNFHQGFFFGWSSPSSQIKAKGFSNYLAIGHLCIIAAALYLDAAVFIPLKTGHPLLPEVYSVSNSF